MTPSIEPREPAKSSTRNLVLRGFGLALGSGVFAWAMRDVDLAALGGSIQSLGPAGLLVLLPQALGLVLHAAAWRALLAGDGEAPSLAWLTKTFVAAEAARMTLPAGPVIGESLAVLSLVRRFGVSWSRAVGSVAAKKAWVLSTHAALLLLAMLLGRRAFARVADAGGFPVAWLWLGGGVMVVVLVGSGATALALLGSTRARRFAESVAARWRRRAGAGAARREAGPEVAQELPPPVAAFRAGARIHAVAAALMAGQWLAEVLDTMLLSRLLGIRLGFGDVLMVELGGTLLRSLAFFVPGGLGVQDASYIGLLTALGGSSAAAAAPAFVLLKRARELCYIAVGLVLLTRLRLRDRVKPT